MPFFSSKNSKKNPLKKIILAIMMLALIGGAAYYSSGDDYTAKLGRSGKFAERTKVLKKGVDLEKLGEIKVARNAYPTCLYIDGDLNSNIIIGFGDIAGGINTDLIADAVLEEFIQELTANIETINTANEPWASMTEDTIPNGVSIEINSVDALNLDTFELSVGRPRRDEGETLGPFQSTIIATLRVNSIDIDATAYFLGEEYHISGPLFDNLIIDLRFTMNAKGDLTFDYDTFFNRQHVLAGEAKDFYRIAEGHPFIYSLLLSLNTNSVEFSHVKKNRDLEEITDPILLFMIDHIDVDRVHGYSLAESDSPEYAADLNNLIGSFNSLSLIEELHSILYARALLFDVHNWHSSFSNFTSVFVHHLATRDYGVYQAYEPYFCDSGQSKLQPHDPFNPMPSLPYVRDWINYNF